MLQWYTMFWGTGSLYLSCSSRKCGKPYVLLSGKVVSLLLKTVYESFTNWGFFTIHNQACCECRRRAISWPGRRLSWYISNPHEKTFRQSSGFWNTGELIEEDRRSKTSDLACLSRAFAGSSMGWANICHQLSCTTDTTEARAACATGPVADKFQAAGSEPPSELLEATVVPANSSWLRLRLGWYRQVIRNFLKAAVKEAVLVKKKLLTHIFPINFPANTSCIHGPSPLRRMLASMSSGPHLHAWWASSWLVFTPWPATNLHHQP